MTRIRIRGGARRFFIVLGVLGLLVALTIFVGLYVPTKPDGRYEDDLIGSVGPAYWVVNEGTVVLETTESTNFVGTCFRSGGKWFLRQTNHGSEVTLPLHSSLLGMTFSEPSASGGERFIPRPGFLWLQHLREWLHGA